MQVGGFVKQSLIDYPSYVAAVIFTQGCNFRCGYCHNPQLVLPELFAQNQTIATDEVLAYLEERRSWLDAVVVTGGEPTIHNDLPKFLKRIKAMGYRVKLDTNGSNPYMLEHIISERLVDCVAMDIKIAVEEALYTQIIGIKDTSTIIENVLASVFVLKAATIDVEFRTTRLPETHNDAMMHLIKKYIGNDKRYTINEFRDGNTVNVNQNRGQ